MIDQHVANQKPAVAHPQGAEVRGRGDLAGEEIAGDGGEVLVGPVAMLPNRRQVPPGELSPTADVRDGEQSTL